MDTLAAALALLSHVDVRKQEQRSDSAAYQFILFTRSLETLRYHVTQLNNCFSVDMIVGDITLKVDHANPGEGGMMSLMTT